MVFKSLHNLTPKYITDLVKISQNNHYVLRSVARRELTHVRPKTNYLSRAFSYSAMKLWNSIPVDIRNAKNLHGFKLKVNRYLFNQSTF